LVVQECAWRIAVVSAMLVSPNLSSALRAGTKTSARAEGSPAQRPVLAVDIDETLCITDYTSLFWGIGKDTTAALPGAQATLNRLARWFDVVYVTARSRSLAGKTQRWLKKNGFPDGRLVTSPSLGDFIFQSGFKRRQLGELRSEYPNMVVGIGDKAKDAAAYRVNGMFPVIVNPRPNQRYRADDAVLQDWSAVRAFFEANRELLCDPRRMNEVLLRGRVIVNRSADSRQF
jgi:hypothetical protein